MSFGLKNVGATYQRIITKVFSNQIGSNLEVYIDDMVVKTDGPRTHDEDLMGIFAQLRKYNMRLNPLKCAFGVWLESFFVSCSHNEESKLI